jgi:hypothetical protein
VGVTVSAPVKIFALVGVLAAVVLGGGMMFLGGGVEAEPAAIVLPKQAAALPATPAKPVAKPKPAAAKPKPAAAKPKPVQKPAKPKRAPLIAANGLPYRVVSTLRRENVVVLALWGSGGKIDRLALDEAAAGAAAAGVGFVPLNVLQSNREAEALTLKLGVVLRAPTVLFFTGSGDLALRLDGFRDRETVAQAALDALR